MGENLMMIMLLGAFSGSIIKNLKDLNKESFTLEDITNASLESTKYFSKILSEPKEEKASDNGDAFDMSKNGE